MTPEERAAKAEERKDKVLRQRVEVAQALVADGRAERVLVQDSQVYVQQGVCGGCSEVGPWLVDKVSAWCPACGGRGLVHLDQTDPADFENGLCRVGTSRVVHLVAPPYGESPVCLRGTLFGRMRGVRDASEPTCKRCIAERDGEAAYGHGDPKPSKRTRQRERAS